MFWLICILALCLFWCISESIERISWKDIEKQNGGEFEMGKKRRKVNLVNYIYRFEREGLSNKELIVFFSTLVRQGKQDKINPFYFNVANKLIAKGYLRKDGKITNKGSKFWINKNATDRWQIRRTKEVEECLKEESPSVNNNEVETTLTNLR